MKYAVILTKKEWDVIVAGLLISKSHFITYDWFSLAFEKLRLKELTSALRKQNAILEEFRDVFLDKKRRTTREQSADDPNMMEFYVWSSQNRWLFLSVVKIARALERDSISRDPGLGWPTADLADEVQARTLCNPRATCHSFVLLDYRGIENAAISRVEVIHHRITYNQPQFLPQNCHFFSSHLQSSSHSSRSKIKMPVKMMQHAFVGGLSGCNFRSSFFYQ